MSLLAIHPGALGDLVLFGRLLERLPGRKTLVAGREKVELLAGLGVADRALDFDSLPMHEVFTADRPVSECRLPSLVGRHERLVSCFVAGDRRAEERLMECCGAASAAFLPVRPPAEFRGHLLDLWAGLLGLPAQAGRGKAPYGRAARAWAVPPEWTAQARRELAGTGVDVDRPFLAIHPGSGGVAKCWPVERFVELAESVRREGLSVGADAKPPAGRSVRQVVMIVGPAECERWGESRVALLRSRLPVLACPSLATLAGILAASAAYVGNDSGPTHLAAAVGEPTTALFGPTNEAHFAPVGPRVRVIIRPDLESLAVGEIFSAISRPGRPDGGQGLSAR